MSKSNGSENELSRNTTIEDNFVVGSRQSYDVRKILDTSVQRVFTILPDINHLNNLHEDEIVIWLDDTIGISVESKWFNIAPQLRQIIKHVVVFNNVKKCIEYIGATGIEQVFLIVTGTFGDNFDARLFEEIINDIFIYVLTLDKLEYNDNHTNIRGYFDNAKTLIDKINDDYMVYTSNRESNINFITIDTSGSTTRCINPQSIQWKCLQLMFDILRRMPCPREQSKDRLIQLYTSYYIENTFQLSQLNEFKEMYQSCDAIHWYTRDDCFLYLLLNRCFRANNIDLIMDFSFVTIDIYDQLHALHCQQYGHTTSSTVFFYRGQVMGIDELQNLKLNVGGFISNNTLLSTTKYRDIALLFSNTIGTTQSVSVLIEIFIDLNSHISKPFAYLSSLSPYPNEEEVLFVYGNIFRIDSCKPTVENIWEVRLTLCDNSCSIVENLSDYFDVAILQLLEILPKISPKTNKANDRMLQWWRLYCNDDPTELAKINQFEESYRSDSAIRWYTKDSILYRLLNLALRHDNIDMIVDFRYFIIDLYEQLTKSHLDYVRSFKEQNLTVYRGQKISLLELKKLKHSIGKYISIKSLFSASLSSEVALCFAELSESDQEQLLQSVLFEIEIDMSRLAQSGKNHIFANIIQLSHFIHEEEVLFMANTRFRIQSVTKWNTFWLVRLTLLSLDDENDHEMKTMNQYLNYLSNFVIQKYGDSIWSFFKNDCVKNKHDFSL